MKEERDGFLSRWSRLKRGAAADPLSAGPAAVAPAQPPALPEGKSLEELIAELPKIEDLVPGQSLGAFMQAWVPTAIRNAALQRMWLLDPAISGYVDPALDYAHDYNTLGAVPGFGPMEASPEAVREVHEMFDRALGLDSETVAGQPQGDDGNVTGGFQDVPSVPAALRHGEADTEGSSEEIGAAEPPRSRVTARDSAPGHGAAQHEKSPNVLTPARFRRHGRALPT